MTVIARDGVAADHLVYAWPFPIGPECEVACSEEEQVVMCPAWMVGDRLGPGHHRWRTPDPTRPSAAYFVLTQPVDIAFDMVTAFVIPTNGTPVRLRSSGSLQVRCADPGLLVAQFVGLPFDHVNEGVLRSVRRSVERMLARLLTRRVVMAGTPAAVTEPGMLQGIVEELIAYNPTAGAVFGVELVRMGYVVVAADDGSTPFIDLPQGMPNERDERAESASTGATTERTLAANGYAVHDEALTDPVPSAPAPGSLNKFGRPKTLLLDTVRGMAAVSADETPTPTVPQRAVTAPGEGQPAVSGEIGGARKPAVAPQSTPSTPPPMQTIASGEITPKTRPERATLASAAVPPPQPVSRRAAPIEVPRTDDDATSPSPVPSKAAKTATPPAGVAKVTRKEEPRSAILGIGMGAIGQSQVSGEIQKKVPVGGRVLVPGPNGLMQSATVRQLLQGYYELEIGSTGQTVWVPASGVVPD